MKRRRFLERRGRPCVAAPLLALAVLAGCGASKRGTGGSDGAHDGAATDGGASDGAWPDSTAAPDAFALPDSVPWEELPAMMARAQCTLDLRCRLAFARVEQAKCETLAAARGPYVTYLRALEEVGRYDYDPQAMADCLQSLADRDCDTFSTRRASFNNDDAYDVYWIDAAMTWMSIPSCRAALLGSGAAGERCYSNFECTTGMCCRGGDCLRGDYTTDPGACVEPVAVGDTCEGGGQPGVCGFDAYCEAGRCQPRKALGETCAFDGECAIDRTCRDPGGGSNRVCTRFPVRGEGCRYDEGCGTWLVCGGGGTCVDHVLPFAIAGESPTESCAGEAASENQCRCLPGLWLDEGVCREPGGLGEPCSYAERVAGSSAFTHTTEFYQGCEAGLFCSADAVCVTASAEGAACSLAYECAAPSVCGYHGAMDAYNQPVRTCGPILEEGDACYDWGYITDLQCEWGTYCRSAPTHAEGTCTGDGIDAACSDSADCRLDLQCIDGKCEPYYPARYFR